MRSRFTPGPALRDTVPARSCTPIVTTPALPDAPRDTIAAIATGPAPGGIGVIRLSGPDAAAIAGTLTGVRAIPRHAHFVACRDAAGELLDRGLLLHFPAPHSYTGEDVVELQLHGSPPLLQRVLRTLLAHGARLARPGEFTERAFLAGKLDLAQAEAVADLIAAGSDAAARAALRSLDGAFSQAVDALLQALVALRVQVEAAIDFPEEEIDFLGDGQIAAALAAVRARHAALLAEARRGQRLRDGLHVVIVGPPNAGKSSLLNALAGSERAIVTAIAGTTRDLLRETVQLDGIELTLVDTAGLRAASDDAIEREGMRRARAERARADLVLAVVEYGDRAAEAALRRELDAGPAATDAAATDPRPAAAAIAERPSPSADRTDAAPASAGPPVVWLHSKIDLHAAPPQQREHDGATHLQLSAATGAGMPALLDLLRRQAGLAGDGGGAFTARARHVDALRRAGAHLVEAQGQLAAGAGELVAEELRLAQDALAAITGAWGADDLLGEIFASFCIGK